MNIMVESTSEAERTLGSLKGNELGKSSGQKQGPDDDCLVSVRGLRVGQSDGQAR